MECQVCYREVAEAAAVQAESFPDQDWIECGGCNKIVCLHCCRHPEIGCCDECVQEEPFKTHLSYLIECSLIRGGEGTAAVDQSKLKTALRLGLRAALSACEHPDGLHRRGARQGCGACRAVVAIREVLTDLEGARGSLGLPGDDGGNETCCSKEAL
jgi:hypothetical protein